MLKFVVLVFVINLVACAGPKPLQDYSLSKSALDYARKAGAESLASGWYYKADTTFKQAESAYKNNENLKAKELFIKARKFAERAENSSRVQKFKSGDGPVD